MKRYGKENFPKKKRICVENRTLLELLAHARKLARPQRTGWSVVIQVELGWAGAGQGWARERGRRRPAWC